MLQLTTPTDSGEIVFADGRVIAVYTTGSTQTVGDGLLDVGLISPTVFQDMLAAQGEADLGPALFERFGVDEERLHDALEELVKRAIYSMFDWDEGTFSFVLEDVRDPWRSFTLDGTRLVAQRGLNPQYLAIEGARLRDERTKEDVLESFLARDKPKSPATRGAPSAEAQSFAAQLRSAGTTADARRRSIPDAGPAAAPDAASAPERLATPAESVHAEKVIPFPKSRIQRDDVARPAPNEAPPPPATSAAAEPAVASSWRLLAIDDDPAVTRALLNRFAGRFATVTTANTVADALPEIEAAPPGLVVISDLIIARSDGGGILGGLEVLESVRGRTSGVPVILFSDYENAEAQERAARLGVETFLMKPRKAQIQADKDGTSPAMSEFLERIGEALLPYLGSASDASAPPEDAGPGDVRGDPDSVAGPPAPEPAPEPASVGQAQAGSTGWDASPGQVAADPASGMYDLRSEMAGDLDSVEFPGTSDLPPPVPPREPVGTLRSMLAELLDPANRDTVTLLVLRFASQIFERAALFLVTRRAYVGLGGFSANESSDKFVARVRRVHVPVDVDSVLSTVAKYRATYRGPLVEADGNRQLIDGFGGPWPSSHIAAIPLISGDRVAAILYGDNVASSELVLTDTLEIFLQQAGLAMDRALLERRLEESRRPIGDGE